MVTEVSGGCEVSASGHLKAPRHLASAEFPLAAFLFYQQESHPKGRHSGISSNQQNKKKTNPQMSTKKKNLKNSKVLLPAETNLAWYH